MVRHGQARLFTDDYDRLSDLGFRQAEALGEFWLERGIRPDAIYAGSLNRQQQTANKIGEAFVKSGEAWPELQEHVGLNEYPVKEITDSLLPALRKADASLDQLATDLNSLNNDADRYRPLHQLLETVVSRWVSGDYGDAEPPISWKTFSEGVTEALRDVMSSAGSGKTIALFTSGGPVAISVQSNLQAPDIKAAELHWRVHNCSVTRYTFSGERVSLDTFNDVAHLPSGMLSYR